MFHPSRRAALGGFAALTTVAVLPARARAKQTPDAALDEVFAATPPPALGAMIVNRDGVEWRGVRGVRRDGQTDPVTLDDRWPLGSNTKAMTAAVWGRFVDQGRARWGMPLAEAFPDVELDAGWAGLTVDDLMHHRAGLLDATVTTREWLTAARSDPRALPEQRAALAASALSAPPSGPRGSFAYGNADYILIGAAIEKIAGSAWEDAVRAEVFQPLGIQTGGFGAPPDPNAWGHRTVDGVRSPLDPTHPAADNPRVVGPAGTIHMTLADYARFLAVFLNDGAGWLSPTSLRVLTTPAAGEGMAYAGGWGVREQPWGGAAGAGPVLGHEGSNGRWHCLAAVAPGRGFAVVTVANDGSTGRGACQQLAQRLTAARAG
jgi:CubicO group peptidase (beta-lactamase class C family)